jgi:aminoglycoside phosphotransferase (APT) family kinase protein
MTHDDAPNGAVGVPGLVGAAERLLGAQARPLSGGYSGETYLVGAAGEEAVLRIYGRDPDRAAVDASLLALLEGLVPVPRVLDMQTQSTDPDAPPFVLMERLPGVRMDTWLPGAPPDLRVRAGEGVARILARLAGIPFLRSGMFVGADLTVEPWSGAAGGLEGWVEAHRDLGGLAVWSDEEIAALAEVARHGQSLLDGLHRVCLAHSDVNPKNLLVDPGTAEITGLVDWEFAHAGSPYTDIGNLLRFETDGVFGRAVADAFAEHAPGISPNFLELGRAVDLLALVDLAARSGRNPVVDQARDLLREMARSGNLAAGRPSWRGHVGD